MNVCLVTLEFHGWGCQSGCGFGRASRALGRALTAEGVRVTAVVPRQPDQPERAELDGIEVFSFPSARPAEAYRWLREIDADVYHSIDPSLLTYFAQRARPARRHVVTLLDPTLDGPCIGAPRSEPVSLSRWLNRRYYRLGRRVRNAVRSADLRVIGARHIGETVRQLYGLAEVPAFLPRPIEVPSALVKAPRPTVFMLDRWDSEKRPEAFFELALRFPNVQFIAAGSASDASETERIQRAWDHVPNLELRPPVDPFSAEYQDLLSRSWILVNPAHRTGLPASFLDAAAHGTAILSSIDPDDFASNFGAKAPEDGLAEGLTHLLENDRWRTRGELGRAYVTKTFGSDRSVSLHLDAYRAVLEREEESLSAPEALFRSA
ncbi:MAG: glycosyltransferase family 4 protein [Gemmatimonadota bacterium]